MCQVQMSQFEDNFKYFQVNLVVVCKNLENFVVCVLVIGYLIMLIVEVGELKVKGQWLGQVDVLMVIKVIVLVDEFYIGCLQVG